ncbi:hypothetical protein J1N35_025434 [Gossypium stocksii]|uniref:RNase H type-1 domain-containing protein n=1 Tax=Gossypium stocksii TaxID=47602 RepID=A0A9D3V6L0_9ROSI|nr:hypothetical protein J1N35_025434 [Gossypium stocksii]
MLASMTICHKVIYSLFATKAQALQLGLECVTIEGDSLTIIKKGKSISKEKSKIGAILTNIQHTKNAFNRLTFGTFQDWGTPLLII